MAFNIKYRDGPARIGELIIKDKKITTPNIAFIHTSRFSAPDFSDLIITNKNFKSNKPTLQIGNSVFLGLKGNIKGELSIDNYLLYPKDVSKQLLKNLIKYNKKKDSSLCIIPANKDVIDDFIKDNDAEIFIVSDVFQLLNQQSKFVEYITYLREKIGYQKLIYLPSIGNPSSFALLTYMGVDLFDSTSAIIGARNDILLFTNGNFNKNDLSEIPCSCPACNNINEKPSEMSFSQILNHNYFSLFNELKQVRNAIIFGNLRELVETRISASPTLAAILKTLDQNQYKFLEERMPIIRKNTLISSTNHSLARPEIKRFQDRVLNRYIKPSCTKILLLLPCSAKKPYSFSKSHKLFREQLYGVKNPDVVHEMIITSPLGIVPRELELMYPASRYDIAVSGIWDEDEKKMIRDLLQNHLKNCDYEKVIIHLPKSIQDFIVDIFDNPTITCIDSPTSKESLEKLSSVLKELTKEYEQVDWQKRSYENLKSIASYQFGKDISKNLLKNSTIRGKYPYQKIIQNSKQLGMVTKDRGIISLTTNGAKILADSHKYWVEISDDFELIGSIFAPGVKDADEDIRIGDEVVLIKKGNIYEVGVAQMNGKEMSELSYGEAVKTRHKC